MTAIKKNCFLSNVIQIVICMKKQVLRFIQSDVGDIFFAGATIIFTE